MRSRHYLRIHGPQAVALAALCTFCAPSSAHAVPEFVRQIKRDLSLDYEPPCGICHIKNNTGVGTAQTPFALALRERGLDAEQRTSLTSALTRADDDKVDSDGDQVDDVDELRAGTDPNSDAPVSLRDQPEPQWGCRVLSLQARAATPARAWLPVALAGLLASRIVARKRRRAHAQR